MMVRPVHQPDGELLAAGQMQRDIAAIVDVGTIEPRCSQHRTQDFLRDAARHRRHRRDEMIDGERRHRCMHAARDDAVQRVSSRVGGLPKLGQLFTEFIEQTGEALRRSLMGGTYVCSRTAGLDDQIDRAILQMQPLAARK